MKAKASVIVGILLVLALLAFLIQGFVRDLLLYPLVYLYWSLRLVYEAVPGAIWWGIAIALLMLLSVKSLTRRRVRLKAVDDYAETSQTRPQTWMRQIKKTRHGDYFKWQLSRELSQLALAHIAVHERLTLEQAREKLSGGELELPPAIQAYLVAGALSKSYGHYTQTESQLRHPGTHSPLELDPEELVSFLESRLEPS